ncbi:DUF4385 domain-containing protein [Larsenimonas salina]|uniref:DUF4385 domain-containing protein n=1 Tax=Larsenimonas salina TaxID=1295565 RepID=UPI0020737E73|nr:DUF4385 domain-containing protein [Larsenimonas salina]MCM5703991.1 DUF4385 domain-containing protein [Larsenimonas salina]
MSVEDPIDYRAHPQEYRIGRGEQGVFKVQPYKGELLPHWQFKTPDVAEQSAKMIYGKFLDYGERDEFVGMDMARKYLQMGYTRSQRYARNKGGRKNAKANEPADDTPYYDPEKARSAEIFMSYLKKAKADPHYQALKEAHKKRQSK